MIKAALHRDSCFIKAVLLFSEHGHLSQIFESYGSIYPPCPPPIMIRIKETVRIQTTLGSVLHTFHTLKRINFKLNKRLSEELKFYTELDFPQLKLTRKCIDTNTSWISWELYTPPLLCNYSTYLLQKWRGKVLGASEINANLYYNCIQLYWEGCVICSIYLR